MSATQTRGCVSQHSYLLMACFALKACHTFPVFCGTRQTSATRTVCLWPGSDCKGVPGENVSEVRL